MFSYSFSNTTNLLIPLKVGLKYRSFFSLRFESLFMNMFIAELSSVVYSFIRKLILENIIISINTFKVL